jgi:hypothetical protein
MTHKLGDLTHEILLEKERKREKIMGRRKRIPTNGSRDHL